MRTSETARLMLTGAARMGHACITDAYFPELPGHQTGKVRESYDLPDGRRVMIATDRQSAFDVVLGAVPLKGQVLTQTARFWFDATVDICPNHVIEYIDPNVIVATGVYSSCRRDRS